MVILISITIPVKKMLSKLENLYIFTTHLMCVTGHIIKGLGDF